MGKRLEPASSQKRKSKWLTNISKGVPLSCSNHPFKSQRDARHSHQVGPLSTPRLITLEKHVQISTRDMSKEVTVALLVITPKWKHLEGPWAAARTIELWHIRTMDYCTAVNMNDYCHMQLHRWISQIRCWEKNPKEYMQCDSLYIKLETSKNETILARNASTGGKSIRKGKEPVTPKVATVVNSGVGEQRGHFEQVAACGWFLERWACSISWRTL